MSCVVLVLVDRYGRIGFVLQRLHCCLVSPEISIVHGLLRSLCVPLQLFAERVHEVAVAWLSYGTWHIQLLTFWSQFCASAAG